MAIVVASSLKQWSIEFNYEIGLGEEERKSDGEGSKSCQVNNLAKYKYFFWEE
jgi:hypothetical protein